MAYNISDPTVTDPCVLFWVGGEREFCISTTSVGELLMQGSPLCIQKAFRHCSCQLCHLLDTHPRAPASTGAFSFNGDMPVRRTVKIVSPALHPFYHEGREICNKFCVWWLDIWAPFKKDQFFPNVGWSNPPLKKVRVSTVCATNC